jgi:transcriptional regulator with PAS, ATPase and Fis domain
MPLSLQAKFLRVLQDKHIRKVGGNQSYAVDVRVIAATNEPLEKKMARQEFREDLFYRISVIPIEIAPLRERREDIMPLVSFFVEQARKTDQKISIDLEAQRILESYNWPGNVRELENAIRHAATFTRDGTIRRDDLPVKIVEAVSRLGPPLLAAGEVEEYRGKSLRSFLRTREREYIQAVIDKMKGDKEDAARALNISLATLYRKLSEEEAPE